jgi:ankyrin repeat protein
LNAEDDSQETPLFWAIREGHLDVVDLLLRKGADIHIQNEDGETPIMMAAILGSKEMIHRLIQYGSQPRQGDDSVSTCLHDAIRAGNDQVVKVLVEGGVDVNKKDFTGDTPLDVCLIEHDGNIQKKIAACLQAAGAESRFVATLRFDYCDTIANSIHHKLGMQYLERFSAPPALAAAGIFVSTVVVDLWF